MPFVTSRVNGLKVAIPNDARNVIHRFAIAGGGNELVFEPMSRKDFEASRKTETQPLGLGGRDTGEPEPTRENAVVLTNNLVDDEPEAVVTKPKRTTRAAKKAETEEVSF